MLEIAIININNTQRFHYKTRKKISYPKLPSAIRPVAHSDELPKSKPPITLPEPPAECLVFVLPNLKTNQTSVVHT